MLKKDYKRILHNINNTPRKIEESILIVDAFNTFLRSFCMVNHINPEGHHIGGLTGFLKSIGYVIKILDPTKVIIIFDGVGNSNNKRNLYPEYKANRHVSRMTNYDIFNDKEEETESINNQMARLIQYLQCLPVSVICIDGIEADDVIGYLACKLEKFPSTKEVNIISADRDFLQLVTDKVRVYSPVKRKLYTPKDILEEYEISNVNFINYKILMGDKSDNLPGIVGLGPKKLLKLFPELSTDIPLTLEDIVEKSTQKIKENELYRRIVEQKQQLSINNQLMNLQTIPLSPDNINIIQSGFNKPYKLDKHTFMSMYVADHLNESIPGTSNWMNQVFGPLESFNI